MAPFAILTPTLGRVEQIQLARAAGVPTFDPLIAWSWWCRGWLRRPWLMRAALSARAVLEAEIGSTKRARDPVWDSDPPAELADQPPQAFAVHASVSLGYGTPDEWRAARYADVLHALAFKGWREAPEKDRALSAPVWGRPG